MSATFRVRWTGAALAALVLGTAWAGAAGAAPPSAEAVRITAGSFRPLYRQTVRGTARDTLVRRAVAVRVPAFWIARHAVTNAEYRAFVRARPEWRRSRVSRLYADASYLQHWRGDDEPGPHAPANAPVVNVSWFAARAYAAWAGGRLPTVAEWERVAAADESRTDATRDPRFLDRIRAWYSRPAPAVLPAVGSTYRNAWGADDLHGLVWEWTLDFNSALVTGESRADASLDRGLYCGAGASGASDFADYAAFMRYALRASLEARNTTSQLGFRIAWNDSAPVAVRR